MAYFHGVLNSLQAALGRCEIHDAASTAVTKTLTAQILNWARAGGWSAQLEWEVPHYQDFEGRRGLLDVYLRGQKMDIAVEIDRSNKQKSVEKLQVARQATGCEAVWVRWRCGARGSDVMIAVPREIHVVEVELAAVSPAPSYKPHSNAPYRAGERWTPHEEQEAIRLFQTSGSVDFVAKRLGRAPGGIAARLVRLGLLPQL